VVPIVPDLQDVRRALGAANASQHGTEWVAAYEQDNTAFVPGVHVAALILSHHTMVEVDWDCPSALEQRPINLLSHYQTWLGGHGPGPVNTGQHVRNTPDITEDSSEFGSIPS
jgi:hypothetical protein